MGRSVGGEISKSQPIHTREKGFEGTQGKNKYIGVGGGHDETRKKRGRGRSGNGYVQHSTGVYSLLLAPLLSKKLDSDSSWCND